MLRYCSNIKKKRKQNFFSSDNKQDTMYFIKRNNYDWRKLDARQIRTAYELNILQIQYHFRNIMVSLKLDATVKRQNRS